MRQEAEAHADEDRKRRETIEIRNQANNAIYSAEKALNEHADKAPAQDKAEVEQAISGLKEAITKDDLEVIRVKIASLSQAIQRIGSSLHGPSTLEVESPHPDRTNTAPYTKEI